MCVCCVTAGFSNLACRQVAVVRVVSRTSLVRSVLKVVCSISRSSIERRSFSFVLCNLQNEMRYSRFTRSCDFLFVVELIVRVSNALSKTPNTNTVHRRVGCYHPTLPCITVTASYHTDITLHYRGGLLSPQYYRDGLLPSNKYRVVRCSLIPVLIDTELRNRHRQEPRTIQSNGSSNRMRRLGNRSDW